MYVFKSLSSYIQKKGILNTVGDYVDKYGDFAMIMADPTVCEIVKQPLQRSLGSKDLGYCFENFQGECTKKEIKRLTKRAEELKADMVIGAGGGKSLDTAKAVASNLNITTVLTPTIASNDSPTSCVSVIYSENGEVEEIRVNNSPPDLVLVDSGIIARAPTRFFIAGMGDVLSTKFEAIACYRANGENKFGGKPTQAAIAIAEQCYSNLLKYGYLAKKAVEKNLVTPQVEKIIETNILLSGLGFENGGLGLAHAINNGLTHIESTHQALHGEKVGFGTIVQLIIEGRKAEEIKSLTKLCISLGLPVTLEFLGIKEVDEDQILNIAHMICEKEADKIMNEPVEINPKIIRDSILLADEIGKLDNIN